MELPALMSNGRVFQSLGAAITKALAPYVYSLADGIARSCLDDDLQVHQALW